MATATTTAAADGAAVPGRPPPLRSDSIPTIDLRLLSQSELYSLSLCSGSSSDLKRCDDVVIPKIDRSVFNESAGSRKQTYSRLRLAPADSSPIHRRTPHVRLSHAPRSNDISDPEQAENAQIVRMLKELFKSDANFEDVAPIEVETNSVPVVPEVLNSETKRKRGRPRKNDNAGFLRSPAKRTRHNAVKTEAVIDNDMDREIVNSIGAKVKVENLAGLEDPYGPEIRRRTEGMSTEDELLGFLGGLNGQWGSVRKKKRVVDASDFGDALPKGWRLSLSIKKKEGRFWLFCHRYISPSGRQFDSCKEVSTYLLSVIGDENLDRPNDACSNKRDDSDSKGAYGNHADPLLREDKKGNSTVHDPSLLPASLRTHSEMQVTSDIGNPLDVEAGELFKCLKCSMIFEGKDDLLDHQVLAHNTPRSEIGTTFADCVVFKENETKTPEASQDEHVGKDIHPLMTGMPDKESPASGFAEGDVAVQTYDANSATPPSNHIISRGTKSNSDEIVQDLNILADGSHGELVDVDGNITVQESDEKPGKKCTVDDDKVPGTDGALDVSVSKSDFCHSYQASMCINQNNGKTETSGDKPECPLELDRNSGGCLLSPFQNEQFGCESDVGKDVFGKEGVTSFEEEDNLKSSSISSWRDEERTDKNVGIFAMEEPKMETSSETCRIENKVEETPYKSKEAGFDDFQFFRNNEAVASLGSSSPNGLHMGTLAFNTGTNLEFCSLDPSGNEQGFDFQDDVTGLYDDDIFGNKLYSPTGNVLKFDEDRDMGSHELSLSFGNPHALYADTINVEQKRDVVNCSRAPSKVEETCDVQTNLSMVNSSMVADLKGERDSRGGLFSLSSNMTNAFQNNDNTVYPGRAWEGDEFISSKDKNFMFGSGSNHGQPHEVPYGQNQIPPQRFFHSFDIMSEKAEDGFSRPDSGVGGSRSGRPEPVEFSFLTGRNLVTGVCAWCRDEFHLQPVYFGPQDGIGSLCPTCSAGIPGQSNML